MTNESVKNGSRFLKVDQISTSLLMKLSQRVLVDNAYHVGILIIHI